MSTESDIAGETLAEFLSEVRIRIATRIEASRAEDDRRRQERADLEKAVAELAARRDDLRGEIEALQAQRVALGEAGAGDVAYRAALAGLILAHVCGCQPRQGFAFPIRDAGLAGQFLYGAGWKEKYPGHWGRGSDGGGTMQEAVKRQILDDLNSASRFFETQRQQGSAHAGRTLNEVHVESLR